MSCSRQSDACRCTYAACPRRGNCCQCVAYHRDKGEVPGCFFSVEGERMWDRSLENFIRDRKG